MAAPARLASIDIVRGVVMVLMAIDHVRVYSGIPAGGPSPGVFFTRWITHFCAPVFVFLAGTSAYLLARRLDTGRLSRRLAVRGLVLVLLELTLIRAAWTFGADYSQFLLAGVIWMLGWSMVLLGVLVWLPAPLVGAIGVAIVVLQPLFATLGWALPAAWQPAWELIYPIGAELTLGRDGPYVATLYTLVPWAGVMCAGYGFGAIMADDPDRRRRRCVAIGLGATALFLVLAGVGAMREADDAPFVIRMLNQRKYPASVPFLLMTLGPAIAALGFTDGLRGRIATVLETFGRVPMAYYLLHIPLIHATSLIVWRLRQAGIDDAAFRTAPYVRLPENQRWELWLLYVVFAATIAILYPICRALGRAESDGRMRWLRYL